MEKKSKKILLITSAILLIGGGVGYWLWKSKKDKDTGKTDSDDSGTPSVDDDKGTPPKGEQPKVDKPASVTEFQDWMDKNHPNWVKGKNLNKGSGYGNFGEYTQKAWATYKTEFQKPKGLIDWGTIYNSPVKPTTTTTPSNVIKKGDAVYALIKDTNLFQYPAGNSLMGKVISDDLTKPIGVFDSYIGDFAKIWMNKSGVKLNGMLLKKPYWAYVYKSMIKK